MNRNRTISRLLVVGMAMMMAGVISGPARGEVITVNFDPFGTGGSTANLPVVQFDQAPGNALAVGALQGGALVEGHRFQVLYQAKIGRLADQNNQTLAAPGFNDVPEMTMVASFWQVVESVTTFDGGSVAAFSTNTDQTGSLVQWYANTSANDRTGAGFTSGDLILEGHVNQGGVSGFASFFSPLQDLDQFNSPGDSPYPGVDSVTGAGGTTLDVSVTWSDSNYFVNGVTGFQLLFNTSNVIPFRQVSPTATMFDGTVPNVGQTNGFSGPDFLFQADANSAFIPEPSSVLMVSLGAVSLIGFRGYRHLRRKVK